MKKSVEELEENYYKVKELVRKRLWNTRKTKKPRQLIYSHLARATGLSWKQIYRIMIILEEEKYIEVFYTYPEHKTCKMYRLLYTSK